MKSKRRRYAEVGAILFGVAFAVFVLLFFAYVPLTGGGSGVIGAVMIPDMILGTVGLWLLIWTGLLWQDRKYPAASSNPPEG